MQNRIKEIRKAIGLNQTEFAEKLGIAPNTISSYEGGTRIPSDAIIKSICREFAVNEEWLRTGEGEMKQSPSREQEMSSLIRHLMADRPESFRSALITTLLRFDPDGPEWALLEGIYKKLSAEIKGDKE